MHIVRVAFLLLLVAFASSAAAQSAAPAASTGAQPVSAGSIDDLIALKRTSGTPAISADGRWVAYAVRETNWTDNAYETEIWLADARAAGSGRPAHDGEEVEQPAGVLARRQVARLRLGSHRHAAALSPVARGRRGRSAHERHRGRDGVRLVARRRAHRLHDDRPGHAGDEGARREVRRVHARRPRHAHGAAARASTWPRRPRVRSRPARSWSARSTGRPTARGSPSITA